MLYSFIILCLDIVFCRTWYKVDVPQLYISITTLLLSPSERNAWKGMRTLGTLKREKGIQNEAQPDSMYMVSHIIQQLISRLQVQVCRSNAYNQVNNEILMWAP